MKRRGPGSDRGVMVGGRGVRVLPSSAVKEADLFVAVDVDLGRRGERQEAQVRMASKVDRAWLDPARIRTTEDVVFDEAREAVTGFRRTAYEDLVLDESQVQAPRGEAVERMLGEAAASRLARALPLDEASVVAFRARVACLRDWRPELALPPLGDEALVSLLPELCRGRRSFAELRKAKLLDPLRGLLDWKQLQALDREAPERLSVPSGNRITLRYEEGRPPVLAVRIQEVFGLRETPTVAGGRVKVLMHLLAPNHRPQQITDDMASFWAQAYHEIRADLRRRYPRHAWPEDPLTARPERRPRRRRE